MSRTHLDDHVVLTLAEAVNNVELEVGEGGEGGVDQLQHGLQAPAVLSQSFAMYCLM